jgi:hypothetical protein
MSTTFAPYVTLSTASLLFSSGTTATLAATDAVLKLLPTLSGDDLIGLTGGSDGRIMFLVNLSRTFSIDVIGESASATAANRFADSHTLDPDTARGFIYDGALSRWTNFL